MPKAEIRLSAAQWELCRQAVGRYGVPQDEASQSRQSRLYAWLQLNQDERANAREGGPDTVIVRHMAGGMKRRLVAIITDFPGQGWRQESWVQIVLPTLAVLGWTPDYDDDEDDEDDDE